MPYPYRPEQFIKFPELNSPIQGSYVSFTAIEDEVSRKIASHVFQRLEGARLNPTTEPLNDQQRANLVATFEKITGFPIVDLLHLLSKS